MLEFIFRLPLPYFIHQFNTQESRQLHSTPVAVAMACHDSTKENLLIILELVFPNGTGQRILDRILNELQYFIVLSSMTIETNIMMPILSFQK